MKNIISFNRIETLDKLARMDARDMRTAEMAEAIGCSKGHVYNLMRRDEYQPLYKKYRKEFLTNRDIDGDTDEL